MAKIHGPDHQGSDREDGLPLSKSWTPMLPIHKEWKQAVPRTWHELHFIHVLVMRVRAVLGGFPPETALNSCPMLRPLSAYLTWATNCSCSSSFYHSDSWPPVPLPFYITSPLVHSLLTFFLHSLDYLFVSFMVTAASGLCILMCFPSSLL